MRQVELWTGREVRHLRQARQMTQRQFAAHLGVADTMVSKWEGGHGRRVPSRVNQEALDESLRRLSVAELQRFEQAEAVDTPEAPELSSRIRWGQVLDLHPNDLRLTHLIVRAVYGVLERHGTREPPPE